MYTEKNQPIRRGPKPKYGKPMTATERKRLSRQKLAQEGGNEKTVRVDGTEMEAIAVLAQVFRMTKKDFMHSVFRENLKRTAAIAAKAALMGKRGATDNDIGNFIHDYLFPVVPTIEEIMKEVAE